MQLCSPQRLVRQTRPTFPGWERCSLVCGFARALIPGNCLSGHFLWLHEQHLPPHCAQRLGTHSAEQLWLSLLLATKCRAATSPRGDVRKSKRESAEGKVVYDAGF